MEGDREPVIIWWTHRDANKAGKVNRMQVTKIQMVNWFIWTFFLNSISTVKDSEPKNDKMNNALGRSPWKLYIWWKEHWQTGSGDRILQKSTKSSLEKDSDSKCRCDHKGREGMDRETLEVALLLLSDWEASSVIENYLLNMVFIRVSHVSHFRNQLTTKAG